MSGWYFGTLYGGTVQSVSGSGRNVVGAALASASRVTGRTTGDLPVLAGVYLFTMASGTTVTCSVMDGDDQKNPLAFSTPRTVVADGATANRNLLPGWDVLISATAAAGNTFEIGVGCYWDAESGSWVRSLPLGRVIPGIDGSEHTVYAANSSGVVQCGTKIVATNAARVVNDPATPGLVAPFAQLYQVGILNPTADEDLTGRLVTFLNYTPGTPDTVQMLIGGASFSVWEVVDGVPVETPVTDLNCDGTTIYQFADAFKYQSIRFVLSTDLAEADEATLFVSEGSSYVEMSLVDGTWGAGTTGLWLTGENCGEGVVGISEAVPFLIRLSAAPDATQTLNMRTFNLRIASEGV